jgi:hypothetical protein
MYVVSTSREPRLSAERAGRPEKWASVQRQMEKMGREEDACSLIL